MKTEAYKELLVSYIAKAQRILQMGMMRFYINSSDEQNVWMRSIENELEFHS